METIEKSYSELIKLKTFKERYSYLKIQDHKIGEDTFGHYRYLNQEFYKTKFWKDLRNKVILRDFGCDMGLDGFEIVGPIYIHHINPLTKADILNHSPKVTDLENLVCTSFGTHNAIHYGNDALLLYPEPIERRKGDTILW